MFEKLLDDRYGVTGNQKTPHETDSLGNREKTCGGLPPQEVKTGDNQNRAVKGLASPKYRRLQLRRLKIGVVGTRGIPGIQGGIENHCENLYPGLVRLGCDITIFTRSPYAGRNPSKEWNNIKLVRIWAPHHTYSETIYHTIAATITGRLYSFDILHIHGIGPALSTPLAKALGMKVVVTHHGPDYERKKWGPFAKQVLKTGEQAGVIFADGIITVSDNPFLAKRLL